MFWFSLWSGRISPPSTSWRHVTWLPPFRPIVSTKRLQVFGCCDRQKRYLLQNPHKSAGTSPLNIIHQPYLSALNCDAGWHWIKKDISDLVVWGPQGRRGNQWSWKVSFYASWSATLTCCRHRNHCQPNYKRKHNMYICIKHILFFTVSSVWFNEAWFFKKVQLASFVVSTNPKKRSS